MEKRYIMSFERETSMNGLAIKRWAGIFVVLSYLCALVYIFTDGGAAWVGYGLWFALGLFADIVFVFPDKRAGAMVAIGGLRLVALIAITTVALLVYVH